MPTTIFYEKDANIELLDGKTVAIIGYAIAAAGSLLALYYVLPI